MSFSIPNSISVPIPHDERDMLGRECPCEACEGYFKVKPGTGLTGPDLSCFCPYCGHEGSPNTFWTKDQIEYAKSVALGRIVGAFRSELKKMEFTSRPRGGFGIGVSLRVQPGPPVPVRHYREPALETDVTCERCTLEYAIYGVFAFCPDCGGHNSAQILEKNLELVEKQLRLAGTLEDPTLSRHLVEDALENCVSALDGFGREAVRVRAGVSTTPGQCASVSFQNLDRAARAVQDLFGVDLRAGVAEAEWGALERAFAKRHLISHRSGVVDAKYVRDSGDSRAVVGRRVEVVPSEVAQVAALLRKLGRGLVQALPAPLARAA